MITYQNGKTVNLIWNKGNVEKTLANSQHIEPIKKFENQTSAPKSKLRKISTRSTQNLQSAKSLKSDRSLPKGLELRQK